MTDILDYEINNYKNAHFQFLDVEKLGHIYLLGRKNNFFSGTELFDFFLGSNCFDSDKMASTDGGKIFENQQISLVDSEIL